MKNLLLNIFIPKQCYSCKRTGSYLCAKCLDSKFRLNYIQKCHVCNSEVRFGFVHSDCSEKSFLDGLIHVALYNNIIKKLIQDAKYKGKYAILHDLSLIMSKYFNKFSALKVDYITFVPTTTEKYNSRGFNQAEILAKNLALNFNLVNALEKKKNIKAQVLKNKFEREEDVKDLYQINSSLNFDFKNKKILVVDDIFTTGSTLNEISKVLKNAGASKVYGFVFAKSKEIVRIGD